MSLSDLRAHALCPATNTHFRGILSCNFNRQGMDMKTRHYFSAAHYTAEPRENFVI